MQTPDPAAAPKREHAAAAQMSEQAETSARGMPKNGVDSVRRGERREGVDATSPSVACGLRPRLLDLFCCEGGASTGYHSAGFDVVGVDINPQPLYPFEFHQGDALDFPLDGFDAIHASPPCQAKTTMSNRWRGAGGKADSHANLIQATRNLLAASCLPYVIENVPGARSDLINPAVLTGEMFGLGVHRPRLFETNWLLLVPRKPPPSRESIGVYGKAHDGRLLWERKDGSRQLAASSLEQAREAMGMPWASWRGCAEAIPPAYTEHIGTQLLAYLASRQEVAA